MPPATPTPPSLSGATLLESACPRFAALLAEGEAPGFNPLSFLPMLAIGLLFYFMFIAPQKRKQQQYRAMVEGLKEHDRVVTIGGIYGVVTNVQRDQEKVTLRTDEGTGSKVKVGIWAISEVLSDEKNKEKEGDKK